MDIKITDVLKYTVAVTTAVIATVAWMDGRFVTESEAKEFATVKKVDKLQKIITFQQLQMVWKDIEQEEKKKPTLRNKEKLKTYYDAEIRLKRELEVQ